MIGVRGCVAGQWLWVQGRLSSTDWTVSAFQLRGRLMKTQDCETVTEMLKCYDCYFLRSLLRNPVLAEEYDLLVSFDPSTGH